MIDSLLIFVKALLSEDNSFKLEDFVNVRSNLENKKGFFHFFDSFVAAVAGKKVWTPSVKVQMTITGCGKVTVSDEAFAEIVLLNYWDRWVNNGKTKWTDSRVGNVEFLGWSHEAHYEYNNIYRRIKNQRMEEEANALVDGLFLQQAREKYQRISVEIGGKKCSDFVCLEEVCMDDF